MKLYYRFYSTWRNRIAILFGLLPGVTSQSKGRKDSCLALSGGQLELIIDFFYEFIHFAFRIGGKFIKHKIPGLLIEGNYLFII